jgi:uncharacterized membrane protein YkoI
MIGKAMIEFPKVARAAAVGGIAFALGLGMIPAAVAGPGKDQRRAEEARAIRAAVARGELLPLPRILSLALARVGGEVVKVELEHERGVLMYEVKILTPSGVIREVELDARTGVLIKIEDD